MKRYRLTIKKFGYPYDITEEYLDTNKSRLLDFGMKLFDKNENYFDLLIRDQKTNLVRKREVMDNVFELREKFLIIEIRKQKLKKINI
jgi:hypothetical protein